MLTDKLRTIQLIATIIIASQCMFYLLAGAEGLRNVSAETFAEQRKAIDIVIAGRMKILYSIAILSGIVILLLSLRSPIGLTFAYTAIATALLIADMIIALRFNIPINRLFAQFPQGDVTDWRLLQLDWLKYVTIRGVIGATALGVLLAGWRS